MLPEITILNANEWHSPTGIPSCRPRFVTKYELECYLGDGGDTCIDGERGILLDKSMTFSRPGQIRNSKFPFSTVFIYFDLSAPNSGFEELIGRIPAFIRPDDGAAELFDRIKLYYRTAPVRAEALLVELLYRLAEEPRGISQRLPRRGQAELYNAIRFMKSNLDRQITSAEMASAAGYSVSHFSELFGELVGMTPQDYFRSLRLGEAKRRLITGKGTSEVASELGFMTVSHFCSAFRRAFGMTPGEFAKGREFIDYEG